MDERVIKRRPFKGSVLFTVLVVMIVMLILMIATIGLASNASRRAYSEYNDHQTTSTARSLVESVVNSLSSENRDLGISIVSSIRNPGQHTELVVNGDGDLGDGMGVVNSLTFTNVGTDSPSGFNITGTGKPIIKITAEVTQGGVTSTYSQYCIGDAQSNNQTSSGGGLIALGGFEGAAEPGVDAHSPAYFGIKNAFTYDKLVTLSNPNNGEFNSLVVNSSAEIKTQMKFALERKEGLSVMGSLFVNDGTSQLFAITPHTAANYRDEVNGGGVQSKDNNYLYVGGTLYLHNNLEIGNNEAPMNLYCGRIVTEANGNIVGNCDIYCYNTGSTAASYDQNDKEGYAKNPWSKLGTDNISKLLSWAEQISDTSNRATNLDSGSFLTMGNLELRQKVSIAGDLFVNGDLRVDSLNTGDSKIKGNVYVAGSITGQLAELDTICDGTIYNGAAATGNTQPYSASGLPAKVTNFLSGDLTLDNLKTNVVKTTEQLYNSFYTDKKDDHGNVIPGEKTFKDSVNKSKLLVNGNTVVYSGNGGGSVSAKDLDGNDITVTSGSIEGVNYKVMITDSCILKGNFDNASIYIKPDSEIWIDCFNFQLSNNSQIIIDDEKGKVNFFFPSDSATLKESNVTTGYEDAYRALFSPYTYSYGYSDKNNGWAWVTASETYANCFRTDTEVKIQTVEYLKHWKSGSVDIITYPTADTDTTNDWMLPKVGFYANENANVLVAFTNNIFVTGDICMPGADFFAKSGCAGTGATITYNGRTVNSGKVGCVGSIIVNTIKQFDNDFGMVYVDDPSNAAPSLPGGLDYTWTPIDGYADF